MKWYRGCSAAYAATFGNALSRLSRCRLVGTDNGVNNPYGMLGRNAGGHINSFVSHKWGPVSIA
jgi:hypothetical protein